MLSNIVSTRNNPVVGQMAPDHAVNLWRELLSFLKQNQSSDAPSEALDLADENGEALADENVETIVLRVSGPKRIVPLLSKYFADSNKGISQSEYSDFELEINKAFGEIESYGLRDIILGPELASASVIKRGVSLSMLDALHLLSRISSSLIIMNELRPYVDSSFKDAFLRQLAEVKSFYFDLENQLNSLDLGDERTSSNFLEITFYNDNNQSSESQPAWARGGMDNRVNFSVDDSNSMAREDAISNMAKRTKEVNEMFKLLAGQVKGDEKNIELMVSDIEEARYRAKNALEYDKQALQMMETGEIHQIQKVEPLIKIKDKLLDEIGKKLAEKTTDAHDRKSNEDCARSHMEKVESDDDNKACWRWLEDDFQDVLKREGRKQSIADFVEENGENQSQATLDYRLKRKILKEQIEILKAENRRLESVGEKVGKFVASINAAVSGSDAELKKIRQTRRREVALEQDCPEEKDYSLQRLIGIRAFEELKAEGDKARRREIISRSLQSMFGDSSKGFVIRKVDSPNEYTVTDIKREFNSFLPEVYFDRSIVSFNVDGSLGSKDDLMKCYSIMQVKPDEKCRFLHPGAEKVKNREAYEAFYLSKDNHPEKLRFVSGCTLKGSIPSIDDGHCCLEKTTDGCVEILTLSSVFERQKDKVISNLKQHNAIGDVLDNFKEVVEYAAREKNLELLALIDHYISLSKDEELDLSEINADVDTALYEGGRKIIFVNLLTMFKFGESGCTSFCGHTNEKYSGLIDPKLKSFISRKNAAEKRLKEETIKSAEDEVISQIEGLSGDSLDELKISLRCALGVYYSDKTSRFDDLKGGLIRAIEQGEYFRIQEVEKTETKEFMCKLLQLRAEKELLDIKEIKLLEKNVPGELFSNFLYEFRNALKLYFKQDPDKFYIKKGELLSYCDFSKSSVAGSNIAEKKGVFDNLIGLISGKDNTGDPGELCLKQLSGLRSYNEIISSVEDIKQSQGAAELKANIERFQFSTNGIAGVMSVTVRGHLESIKRVLASIPVCSAGETKNKEDLFINEVKNLFSYAAIREGEDSKYRFISWGAVTKYFKDIKLYSCLDEDDLYKAKLLDFHVEKSSFGTAIFKKELFKSEIAKVNSDLTKTLDYLGGRDDLLNGTKNQLLNKCMTFIDGIGLPGMAGECFELSYKALCMDFDSYGETVHLSVFMETKQVLSDFVKQVVTLADREQVSLKDLNELMKSFNADQVNSFISSLSPLLKMEEQEKLTKQEESAIGLRRRKKELKNSLLGIELKNLVAQDLTVINQGVQDCGGFNSSADLSIGKFGEKISAFNALGITTLKGLFDKGFEGFEDSGEITNNYDRAIEGALSNLCSLSDCSVNYIVERLQQIYEDNASYAAAYNEHDSDQELCDSLDKNIFSLIDALQAKVKAKAAAAKAAAESAAAAAAAAAAKAATAKAEAAKAAAESAAAAKAEAAKAVATVEVDVVIKSAAAKAARAAVAKAAAAKAAAAKAAAAKAAAVSDANVKIDSLVERKHILFKELYDNDGGDATSLVEVFRDFDEKVRTLMGRCGAENTGSDAAGITSLQVEIQESFAKAKADTVILKFSHLKHDILNNNKNDSEVLQEYFKDCYEDKIRNLISLCDSTGELELNEIDLQTQALENSVDALKDKGSGAVIKEAKAKAKAKAKAAAANAAAANAVAVGTAAAAAAATAAAAAEVVVVNTVESKIGKINIGQIKDAFSNLLSYMQGDREVVTPRDGGHDLGYEVHAAMYELVHKPSRETGRRAFYSEGDSPTVPNSPISPRGEWVSFCPGSPTSSTGFDDLAQRYEEQRTCDFKELYKNFFSKLEEPDKAEVDGYSFPGDECEDDKNLRRLACYLACNGSRREHINPKSTLGDLRGFDNAKGEKAPGFFVATESNTRFRDLLFKGLGLREGVINVPPCVRPMSAAE